MCLGGMERRQFRVAFANLTDGEDTGFNVSHPVTSGRCARKCRRHMRQLAGTLSALAAVLSAPARSPLVLVRAVLDS